MESAEHYGNVEQILLELKEIKKLLRKATIIQKYGSKKMKRPIHNIKLGILPHKTEDQELTELKELICKKCGASNPENAKKNDILSPTKVGSFHKEVKKNGRN